MKQRTAKNVPGWATKLAAQTETSTFYVLLGALCMVLASIEWFTEVRYPTHTVSSWLSRYLILIFILLGIIMIYKGFKIAQREGVERNRKDDEVS